MTENKNIVIAEYLNYVDNDGNPIGHGKKVFKEAVDLLAPFFSVYCIAAKPYILSNEKTIYELEPINQEKIKSVELIKKKLKNIREIFRNSNSNVIWFTNIDWVLLAYLAIFPTRKKVVVTLYRNIIEDMLIPGTKFPRLKKKLVERGLGRANLTIVTNPQLKITNHQIHIPDYYIDEKYSEYLSRPKKPVVSCLGAMRESKDLVGLIDHFKDSDVEVQIIGGFNNDSLFEKVNKKSSSNISVKNKHISYEEFYSIIAESEFVILPYKTECYQQATSGILLETIFLESIPIAPRQILEENNINGIGYLNISDLPKSYAELHAMGIAVKNNKDSYNINVIRKKLYDRFTELR